MLRTWIVAALLALPGPAWCNPTKITLAVANMTCATCPVAVRTAIRRVPGVEAVEVDFDRKIAIVIYDDAVASVETLTAASRDAGFPATHKE